MSAIVSTKHILGIYDECLRYKTPSECKDLAVSTVGPLVNTYLASYDACKKVMSADRCKGIMSAEQDKFCKGVLIIASIAFIWEIIR